MDHALLLTAIFCAGISFGYPLGRMATVGQLKPLIHKMSERILELEEQLCEVLQGQEAKIEVKILERMLRKG